jgi:hypothetical protein
MGRKKIVAYPFVRLRRYPIRQRRIRAAATFP